MSMYKIYNYNTSCVVAVMAKRLYIGTTHTHTRGGRNNLLWAYNNNNNIPSGYLFIIIIISPRSLSTRRVCIALARTHTQTRRYL